MAGERRPAVCLGSGMCAAPAPELFELDDVAKPLTPDIEPDQVALDAAGQCPARAITACENGVESGRGRSDAIPRHPARPASADPTGRTITGARTASGPQAENPL